MCRLLLPLSTTMTIKTPTTIPVPIPLQPQEAQPQASLLSPKPSEWAHTSSFLPVKTQGPDSKFQTINSGYRRINLYSQSPQAKSSTHLLLARLVLPGIAGGTQNWAFRDSYIYVAGFNMRATLFSTFEDSFCIVPSAWRRVHGGKRGKHHFMSHTTIAFCSHKTLHRKQINKELSWPLFNFILVTSLHIVGYYVSLGRISTL